MPTVVVTPAADLPTLTAASPAAAAFDGGADGADELERQVRVYADLGFPALLGTDEAGLRAAVAPLRGAAAELAATPPGPTVPAEDHVPFVLVLAGVRVNDAVPAMRRGKLHGVSVIDEEEAVTYRAVDGVELPGGAAYLVGGVDVGTEFLGVTPETALAAITGRGRTPLTIAEGLSLVIVRPEMLRPGRCFSLAGSRTGTNQRVPAIWISQRRPKLGWCWDRNPHTWLGTASAARRRA